MTMLTSNQKHVKPIFLANPSFISHVAVILLGELEASGGRQTRPSSDTQRVAPGVAMMIGTASTAFCGVLNRMPSCVSTLIACSAWLAGVQSCKARRLAQYVRMDPPHQGASNWRGSVWPSLCRLRAPRLSDWPKKASVKGRKS